jgi:type VI protein secretion system component VasF
MADKKTDKKKRPNVWLVILISLVIVVVVYYGFLAR